MTAQDQRWIVVVPARLASTRLPEKPLQDLGGKPLIVRVCENLKPLNAKGHSIVVAVDSPKTQKILEQARLPAGFSAVMTKPEHPSGTDRCWEVAQKQKADFVLNVQGDEPFIAVSDLEKLMQALAADKNADIATLAFQSSNAEDFANANAVKVLMAKDWRALYFTRAMAPHNREKSSRGAFRWWHHIGVYAYRREALAKFCALEPSPLETCEKLEQLRALENGMRILVVAASAKTLGIDTPQDLEAARAHF